MPVQITSTAISNIQRPYRTYWAVLGYAEEIVDPILQGALSF